MVALFVVACSTATPEVITVEKEVVVEKEKVVTVEVEKAVTVEVEKAVEVEKVVKETVVVEKEKGCREGSSRHGHVSASHV